MMRGTDLAMAGMMEGDATALDWTDSGSVAAAALALREHPLFDAAMLRSARGIIDTFKAQPLLNLVMNDRARYLFLAAALSLHVDPDSNGNRLLPSRLVAFCDECQICSRGRAKAMLAALNWAGYLEPGEPGMDRRLRPLVPTAAFLDVMRRRWRAQISIVAPLRPEAIAADRALADDPELVCDLARVFITRFRLGFRVLDHAPTLLPLTESNAAFPMLLKLYLADREQQAQPSIAAIARRFGASRAHVRATIKVAEAQGLLALDADTGVITIRPALEENLATFFSTTLLVFADLATHAIAARAGR